MKTEEWLWLQTNISVCNSKM